MLQRIRTLNNAGWNPWSDSEMRLTFNDSIRTSQHKMNSWISKRRDWARAWSDQQRKAPVWLIHLNQVATKEGLRITQRNEARIARTA